MKALLGIDPNYWIICVAFSLYVFVWSVIAIAELHALNLFVWDLGWFSQGGWTTFNNPWTAGTFASYVFVSGGSIFVAPITYAISYPQLLVLQSAVIAAPVFFLYSIAKSQFLSRSLALAVALGYLVYGPLAGLNWYDVHLEAFLPLLFVAGFWAYSRGHRYTALALFSLVGLLRFPYSIFPLLLGLFLMMDYVWSRLPIQPALAHSESWMAKVLEDSASGSSGAPNSGALGRSLQDPTDPMHSMNAPASFTDWSLSLPRPVSSLQDGFCCPTTTFRRRALVQSRTSAGWEVSELSR